MRRRRPERIRGDETLRTGLALLAAVELVIGIWN